MLIIYPLDFPTVGVISRVLGTFPKLFPKNDFPSDNISSGNFPNVQFSKRQLPKG